MRMKNWMYALFFLMAGVLLNNCTQYKKTPFDAVDLNDRVGRGYTQKVDNFLVIFDASNSMSRDVFDNAFSGPTKIVLAKEMVSDMNQTIPNLTLTGGLRIFGIQNTLLYGMEKYTKQGLDNTLSKITNTDGTSPLASAINSAGKDLKPLSGNSAVIIVSDGKDMDTAPVQAAQTMKKEFDDKLCIYTVQIGNDVPGAATLQQISDAGVCGTKTTGNAVSSPQGMADFVETVFFKKGQGDSDGDGVYDNADRCPNTPKGVAVDNTGCPRDSDGDGVYDYQDNCPDTPAGMKVDSVGCPLPVDKPMPITLLVEFDFDKDNIRPQYHNHLKAIAEYFKANPEVKTLLEGHTDWEGTPPYNVKLSERRAMSVKKYLVDTFGIKASRLATKGYGETQPLSTNDSTEGRQRNRRVVAKFYAF